jgi:cell division protease FtsH
MKKLNEIFLLILNSPFAPLPVFIWLTSLHLFGGRFSETPVPFTEVMAKVSAQTTQRVEIDGSEITVFEKDGTKVVTHAPTGSSEILYQTLTERSVPYGAAVAESDPWWAWMVEIAIAIALTEFLRIAVKRSQVSVGGGRILSQYGEETTRPTTTFADVGGYDEVKLELAEVGRVLRDPSAYERMKVRAPRGVLFTGPAGTGKTLFARALAGELGVNFIVVNTPELVSKWLGQSSKHIRDVFAKARKHAPCIIFFDELDAVGATRSSEDQGGAGREQDAVVNALLLELDGFKPNAGILVVGATNRVESLDPALRRPGRFDRIITLGLPDRAARVHILQKYLAGRPMDATCDIDRLAGMTSGQSGAVLENLVNEAALVALRRGQEAVIGWSDLVEGLERAALGISNAMDLSVEHRRRVAVHEVGHAFAAAATGGAKRIQRISILSHAQSLGHNLVAIEDGDMLLTRSAIRARIAHLLGGKIAEEVILGEASVGATQDLQYVYKLLELMLETAGIGEGEFEHLHRLEDQGFSETQERALEAIKREEIGKQAELVREVIRHNQVLLEEAVAYLLNRDMLDGSGLSELLAQVQPSAETPKALTA